MSRPPAPAESQFHLSARDFQEARVVAKQRRKFGPRAEALAARLPKDARVLDVGCAYGFFLSLLRQRGMRTVGVDLGASVLAEAEGLGAGLLAAAASAEDGLPFRSGSLDAVTAFDVIEHLHRPEAAISEVYRVLAPGGLLSLSTPKGDAAYLLRRVPFLGARDQNPGHIHVRPPAYWDALLTRQGFRIEERSLSDWLSHLRGATTLGRVLELTGARPGRIPGLRFLAGTYLVLARKPA